MDKRRHPHWLRRAWQNFKETVVVWRAPGIAGIIGTVGSWTVWYYSSVPCTVMAAMAGRCNPGVFASYITLPVLTSCLGIGAGCVAIVGGYNVVMLNRERQRADAAEERAIQSQERANQIEDESRERMFEIEEERREQHRQFLAERRQSEQERRQVEQERLQMERERHQADMERHKADLERRRLEQEQQQADLERRRAEQEDRTRLEQERLQMEQERREEHRQFMATQQAMLDAITQMVQRQNGRPSHDASNANDARDAHNPQQQ